VKGEAGTPVPVVSLPAEDGPRNEARPQAGLDGVEKVLTATQQPGAVERDARILLPPSSVPPRRIVLVVDVAPGRYSLALLVARTGVAVAHRRLGPSSSATTSTVDRALPSSAVQVRCWSRPTTTTGLPYSADFPYRVTQVVSR
jgi:hypothetical protein